MIYSVNEARVYEMPQVLKAPKVDGIAVDSFRSKMVSNTDMIGLANNKQAASFEQTILKAFDDMNKKQINMNTMTEKMIVDPDSVDVHDVTIGMAEASLSLKLAQTVVDRLIKSWNDITTAR